MPDQPDVPRDEGVRQPSNRIATDFELNEKFVEAIGPDKAQAFGDLLRRFFQEHAGGDMAVVKARLKEGTDRIGVPISDVELDSYADQIVRSERVFITDEFDPHNSVDPGNSTDAGR